MSLSNRRAMLGSGLKEVPNNEIWYTNGSTTENTTPNNTEAFDAGIISNTYDVIHKCWRLKFDGKVTMIGYEAFLQCEDLTSVIIPNGVISIGQSAFQYCENLNSIIIPDSVTSIGGRSFYFCKSITNVTIPNSVTEIGGDAFYYCEKLTSITIPDSVNKIGSYAFDGCSSLTNVIIGNGVTEIGFNAFGYCKGNLIINSKIVENIYSSDSYPSKDSWLYNSQFTSLTIGDNVNVIGDWVFSGCKTFIYVNISNNVIAIGQNAFNGCRGVESIDIPNSVTSIGESAFQKCGGALIINSNNIVGKDYTIDDYPSKSGGWLYGSQFTSLTIGDNVNVIGDWIFGYCTTFVNVEMGDNITSIGDSSFYKCTSLISANISDNIVNIGNNPFLCCNSLREFGGNNSLVSDDKNCLIVNGVLKSFAPAGLTEYTIPNNVSLIGDYAFCDCNNLNRIVIHNSVTSIGNASFKNSSVSNIVIGDGVSTIGNEAFAWCNNITEISIPDRVTLIGNNAFYNCNNLNSVTIGNSIISIGDWAFGNSGEMTSVYCKNTSPSSLGNGVFKYFTNNNLIGCYIYVPFESVNIYKNADGWIEYKDYIVGYDFENGEIVRLNNEIWYTSIDGNIVEPYEDAFGEGNSLLNNTYSNGRGVITFENDVTTIGGSAFENCDSLTSVTIPDSVTDIGESAFRGCSSLQEFNGKFASEDGRCLIIDGTLNSFAPAGIDEYTIPDSVTTIGNYAFSDCYNLINITIPDSVETIGNCAFGNCRNLEIVTIGDNITSIGNSAFESCSSLTSIIIPDSVTTIGNSTFAWCNSLTSVTIPDSITSIGSYAFRYCSNLTSVTIPDSVETIGSYAFYSCAGELIINSKHIIESDNYTNNNYPSINGWLRYANFEEIIIGENIEKIGKYTFAYCKYAKKISISCNQITSIGQNAFFGCEGELVVNCNIPLSSTAAKGAFYKGNFSSITIGDSVTSIGKYAFNTCTSQYLYINYNIPQLTTYSDSPFYGSIFSEVVFGDNVSTIGDYAFYNCNSITSITIPDGDEIKLKIGGRSFYGCKSLTEVNLGNKVSEIGIWAFCDCDNLESITIPNRVETIGQSAFNNCDLLANVIFNNGVSNIGSSAFKDCNNLKKITFNKDVDITKFLKNSESNGLKSALNVEKIYINCNIPEYITQDKENKLCGIDLSKVELHIGENAYYNDNYEYLNTIGREAFKDCTIKKIVLYNIRAPYTENNKQKLGIDSNAFYNCNSELEVKCNIYDGNYNGIFGYFAYSGFTKVNIYERDSSLGAPISIIGDYAFYQSNSISEVNILVDTISSIGDYAFYNCDSLNTVHFKSESAEGKKSKLTTIGDQAFHFCKSLMSVENIPDSVTTIGDLAFYNCYSLKSIDIPDSVTTIGNKAFYACRGFTSVTIPDSTTTIGDNAFAECDSLTSITIPDSVTTLGKNAFAYCNSNTSEITLNCNCNIPNVDTYEDGIFYNSNITKVTMGEGVQTIGDYGFYGCNLLTTIRIPKTLNYVGKEAFSGTSGINTVFINDVVSWCNIDFNDYESNPLHLGNAFLYKSPFSDDIIELNKVTTLRFWANTLNTNGVDVVTPDDMVKEIKDYAFYNYKGFKDANNSRIRIGYVNDLNSWNGKNLSGKNRRPLPENPIIIGTKAFYNSTFKDILVEWCINNNNGQKTDKGIKYWFENIKFKDNTSGIFSENTILKYRDYNREGHQYYDTQNSRENDEANDDVIICLESLDLTAEISRLNDYTLANYKKLNRIYVSDTYIYKNNKYQRTIEKGMYFGEGVFRNSSLKKICFYEDGNFNNTRDKSLYNWCTATFEDVYSNPFSVTDVGVYNSKDKTLDTLYIGKNMLDESVTSINDYAFYNCPVKIQFNNNMKIQTIGEYAFAGCSSLTSVTIPDSVTTIGYGAFVSCIGLKSVTIPDSVTTIETLAFFNCGKIVDVSYKGTIDKWVSIDFNDKSSNPLKNGTSKLFTYNSNNTLTEISKLVTSISGQPKSGDLLIDMSNNTNNNEIKKYAFYNAYTSENLKGYIDSIIIKGATSIGVEAFSKMGMKNIVIDDACQTIGTKAFYDCININNIQIGGSASCSLKEIGDNAFATTQLTVKADGVENYLHKFVVFRSSGITITSVQNIFENRIHESAITPFSIYCYSNDNQTVGVWSNTGYTSLWYVTKCTIDSLRQFYGFKNNKVTTGTHWTDIGTDYDIY